MAKYRTINTTFWNDNYVRKLDPTERYLFLYLLTNERTNIAGIYEAPLETIAFETGIKEEMLKTVISRFERDNKTYYFDGWVYIKNFSKHQAVNPKIVEGVKRIVFKEIPKKVLIKIKDAEFLANPSLKEIDYDSLSIDYDSLCIAYDKLILILILKLNLTSPFNSPTGGKDLVEKKSSEEKANQEQIPEEPEINLTARGTKRKNQEVTPEQEKQIAEIINRFKPINPAIRFTNKSIRNAAFDLIKSVGYGETLEWIEKAISVQAERFAPTIATPNQLRDKMGELKVFLDRQKSMGGRIGNIEDIRNS